MTRRKVPYLKNSFKTSFAAVKEWKLFDGAQGCTLLDTHGLGLTMAKTPPPLVTKTTSAKPSFKQATAAAASAASAGNAAPKKEEPPLLVAAWREMQGWGSKKSEDGTPKVEPFDLYDLPIGMHADGFPVSEAFAKRWLNGRAYTAYVKDPKTGEMVEGRYDKDMIDTDTVKLNWLLRSERIKGKYEVLVASLETQRARLAVAEIFESLLRSNPGFYGELDTLKQLRGDLQDLHSQFQFQKSAVNIWDERFDLTVPNLLRYLNDGGVTDVAASLGSFSFYATIARAIVRQQTYKKYNTSTGTQHCVRSQAEVTHVYAYARDCYSFQDDSQYSSQYLGHWNKTGVVMHPAAALASMSKAGVDLGTETLPPFPVDIAGKLLSKDIYYPIHNRDFVKWRDQNVRGGDFLIYSDLKLIKLSKPMVFDLEEVCQ